MKEPNFVFTSEFEKIGEFLYRPEILNHPDIVYMNFVTGTGIFEDKLTGSHIYIEFTDDDVSRVSYSLRGVAGTIHEWVRKFQHDFNAQFEQKC